MTEAQAQIQIQINGVSFPVKFGHTIETCPPFQYYMPTTDNVEIKWTPSSVIENFWKEKKDDEMARINWQNPQPTPSILVSSAGDPLTCKLVEIKTGKVICDYGSSVYMKRGGSCCFDGSNSQSVIKNKFYVGKPCHSVGNEITCAYFDYNPEKGVVKFTSAGCH